MPVPNRSVVGVAASVTDTGVSAPASGPVTVRATPSNRKVAAGVPGRQENRSPHRSYANPSARSKSSYRNRLSSIPSHSPSRWT